MSELKACPFCGREPTRNKYHISCNGLFFDRDNDCGNNELFNTVEDWNTRPIEDALRAENERLCCDVDKFRLSLLVEATEVATLRHENERLRAWSAAWKRAAKWERSYKVKYRQEWTKVMNRYINEPPRDIDPETYGGECYDCGGILQIVRPGKWQCPECG